MARVPGELKNGIVCDFLLAWNTIANGVTAQTAKTREKDWQHWSGYCHNFRLDLFLQRQTACEKAVILTGFAARVRTGAYGNGNQVNVQTVANALSVISKTNQLVGKQSPVLEKEGEYILPLKRMVERFKRIDPPAIPQMAVPKEVPEAAQKVAYLSSDARLHAAGDLTVIAFYFLLCSGEFTKPRRVTRNRKIVRATRTIQFRVCDVGFWKDNTILSCRSPLEILCSADSATMKITNQKNGRTRQTLHHKSTGPQGAIEALACRVHYILSNGGTD